MKGQEEFLKNELAFFINKHSTERLSLCDLDDIGLSYMLSILEELAEEQASEDTFDVDQFTEMMEAYIPGFAQISSVSVSEWMFMLAEKLSSVSNGHKPEPSVKTEQNGHTEENPDVPFLPPTLTATDNPLCSPDSALSFDNPFKYLLSRPMSLPDGDILKKDTDNKQRTQSMSSALTTDPKPKNNSTSSYPADCRQRTVSSSSTLSSSSAGVNGEADMSNLDDEEEDDPSVLMLLEMFPSACTMEINHCLSVVGGNMEEAAQLILSRQECGQSILNKSSSQRKLRKPGSKKANMSFLDDHCMKKKIINQYSYVDVDLDKKEYRPDVRKKQHQEKKMIRYLDSKIVSTKGERFTEIKKAEDEKMKKTFVNLKPAKQYRFH